MGEVVQFPYRDAVLTKRQLAEHLGRSPRWVELRVADGMPSRVANGGLVFRLSEVDQWLGGDAA